MRRTGLDYIRRGAHYLLDEAVKSEQSGSRCALWPNPYRFNPKKPWDHCYRLAIDFMSPHATKYWDKYVKIPCMKINSENARADQFLQDDCKIAATPEEHMATGGLLINAITPVHQHMVLTDIPTGPYREPKVKAIKNTPDKQNGAPKAKKDQHGRFTHNNKGVKVCGAFQNQNCSAPCPSHDAHQCNKCLQNNHGASTCGQVKTKEDKVGKGKGKGKGNRGRG